MKVISCAPLYKVHKRNRKQERDLYTILKLVTDSFFCGLTSPGNRDIFW